MANAIRGPGRPRRIGVFIGGVVYSFLRDTWNGVLERAAERGVETVGFLGHVLNVDEPSRKAMNIAYRMASPANVDGIIVHSNTLGVHSGTESVLALMRETGLPAVSIGYAYEGIPSVTASGYRAMHELTRHLVEQHGRRHLALVTGPAGNVEAIEREAAFRDALAATGIRFDEALLYRGAYGPCGAAAVERFIAGGRRFDAVVCFNDLTAMGAAEALRRKGAAMPRDVAVTGFDGIVEGESMYPSLTTVHQPAREMAAAAVDMLLELLDRGEAASRSIDCRFEPRESCGCDASPPLDEAALASERPLGEAEAELLGELEERAGKGDALGAMRALERALALRARESAAIPRWRGLLYGVRSRVGSAPGGDAAGSGQITCFDQATARLEEIGRRWEAEGWARAAERRATISWMGNSLLGQFSLVALIRRWEACMKAMGIAKCYLVLFEGGAVPGASHPPARSRLVESSPANGGLVELRFPTERLIPDEIRRRRESPAWIVEPLTYQHEALGYLIVEGRGEDMESYESLREIMSSSIKGALLLEEIADSKSGLERQVYFRTIELQEANSGLLDMIERRKELEREVREISNRTMQAIGQDLHDDLCPHLVGISMLASILEERLARERSKYAGAASEIHGLLRDAVDRSRQFARTLYPPRLAEEGIASAVDELVETMGKSAGGATISLQTEGDCRIDDVDKSLNLFRIIQEALGNALRHSGSDDVIVRMVGSEGRLLAEVRDFGRGIPPGGPGRDAGEKGRGMGLRIMRYRAEAIGARLEICNLDPGTRVSCVLTN
jgi:DNA-binding LacI/PurR family transcriptional regulator/signal transduction histidine kinase